MRNNEIRDIGILDTNLYSCISPNISVNRVVLTDKQIIHIAEKHPEAYNDVLIELKETISNPDYIIKDKKHSDTGLVVRRIIKSNELNEHCFIVLRINTNSNSDSYANSIISGWKVSDRRLQRYLRNNTILYRRE